MTKTTDWQRDKVNPSIMFRYYNGHMIIYNLDGEKMYGVPDENKLYCSYTIQFDEEATAMLYIDRFVVGREAEAAEVVVA